MGNLVLTPLGTPVKTARLFADALVPRADGGWNFIAQFYNYPNENPTEWVVMNLETGHYCINGDVPYTPGERGKYVGSGFQINNQMRAPNGRVFFGAVSAWWWYYDPATETVVDGGRVPNAKDSSLYTLKFNRDGSMLYGGTLGNLASDPYRRPMVLTIDPNTLDVTPLCRVGSKHHTENAYAYRLRADGDWLYVCVGEDIWDVVAVNIPSKTQKVLATSKVVPWAEFEQKPEGMTVKLYQNFGKPNQTFSQFWVADGKKFPYKDGYDPCKLKFVPRDTTPYRNSVVNPPQIDETFCPKRLRWRPFGSAGPWASNDFSITHVAPIPIESLLLLPDGSILGDVEQYQGFFRFDPATAVTTYFGAFGGLTEGSSRLVVNGKAYLGGYPNAPLYEYDPNTAWIQTGPNSNPKLLGRYSDGVSLSGIKRSEVIVYGSTPKRIYTAGPRDRSGHGAGVGYYDLATQEFSGSNTGLNFYVGGLGLAVFNSVGRVVFGGRIGDDPAYPGLTPNVAQLVIYDLNLNEIERQTPIAGLLDTGRLFRSSESTVVIGLSKLGQRLYRWDIVSKTLLQSVDLTPLGQIGAVCQGPTGTLTAVLGSSLVQINPETLVITNLGTLANPDISCIAQRNTDLYVSNGAMLSVIHTI